MLTIKKVPVLWICKLNENLLKSQQDSFVETDLKNLCGDQSVNMILRIPYCLSIESHSIYKTTCYYVGTDTGISIHRPETNEVM
jgi:hypothetical protein